MHKPPYQLLAIKQDQSHLNAIANMFSLRSQLEGKQGPYQFHNGSTNQDNSILPCYLSIQLISQNNYKVKRKDNFL
jgi:hypothetical protein